MKLVDNVVSCAYTGMTAAEIQTNVNNNQEGTGFLAVTIAEGDATDQTSIANTDNVTAFPVPRVRLASANTDVIYGALATVNTNTQRCGVITSGIVPFRKSAASVGGDIARGISGAANGQVTVLGANLGTGTVVARDGNRVFVDLDVANNTT